MCARAGCRCVSVWGVEIDFTIGDCIAVHGLSCPIGKFSSLPFLSHACIRDYHIAAAIMGSTSTLTASPRESIDLTCIVYTYS